MIEEALIKQRSKMHTEEDVVLWKYNTDVLNQSSTQEVRGHPSGTQDPKLVGSLVFGSPSQHQNTVSWPCSLCITVCKLETECFSGMLE